MYVTIVKKNTDKDLIKFPKGLDLNKAQTRYRQQRYKGESMSGISSWKYADKWFILPKGMGIFKNYASDGDEQDRNMRMLNELLCQELAKQFGIECAEYELSHYENDRGLITYNVLKDRERLLSGRTLSEITKCYSDNTLSGYNNMLKKKWIVTRKEIKLSMGYINKPYLTLSHFKQIGTQTMFSLFRMKIQEDFLLRHLLITNLLFVELLWNMRTYLKNCHLQSLKLCICNLQID